MPVAVAAITVPELVTRIGPERFGILTLAWGLVGYAGALDLGIGRALTQQVGVLIGKNQLGSIATVLATASRITLVSGLLGSALIIMAALLGATAWVKNTNIPQIELKSCLLLLAVALPAQAMSATYKGLNEAFLNFKSVSILRAILGALNFGGPYLICLHSSYLPTIICSLVVSRLIALYIYRKLALDCLRATYTKKSEYSREAAKALFGFGGWLTLSSLVSPVLLQADRFIIASTISAAAVFVYVLPYEMVVQSLVLVGAISSVIFPALTRLMHEHPTRWQPYFKKWLLRVAVLMAAICLLIAFSLPWVLPIWIKNNLNPESIVIGQILCVGVFANSLAAMFYALLHAQGKVRVTAKLHLVELPLFLMALLALIPIFGIQGAAFAWVGRMVFDFLALAWIAKVENV